MERNNSLGAKRARYGWVAALLATATWSTGCASDEGGRGAGGGAWTAGVPSSDDPDAPADDDDDDDAAGTVGDDDDDAGTAGDDDDDDSNDGFKFDLPDGTGGELPEEEDGCQKVDFVFVIDSSPSMVDEQDNLLQSFPGFIDAIENTLQIDDFHVMVVDAGQIAGGGCDGTLGAGQITSALGQNCGLAVGQRYATQDQGDLAGAFTCMGSRGDAGSANEQTMDALLQSIGPLSAPGACNEGFLRDDAILVVTIITDEEDNGTDGDPMAPLDGSCIGADDDPNSLGDPASWKTALVNAKWGDEEAVVVLGLIGDCDVGGACPGIEYHPFNPLQPFTGAEPAPRLRAFTESFPHGTTGPVCTPDYAPFFADAVNVIDSACSDFEPPG